MKIRVRNGMSVCLMRVRAFIALVMDRPNLILVAAASNLAVAAAMVCAALLAPTYTFGLHAKVIQPELGFAYIAPVPKFDAMYELRGDLPDDPFGSNLTMYEDGKRLGPPHAQHAEIREVGQGRFSHWAAHIRFAATDNTNPSANGRRYTATAEATLAKPWSLLGGAAFVAGVLLLKAWTHARPSAQWDRLRLPLIRTGWLLTRPLALTMPAAVLFLFAGAIAGAGGVVIGWFAGGMTQIGVEIARFLPLSDALGYHSCATVLATSGDLFSDFCTRRVLYVAMLSSLLPGLGWSTHNALIAQGVLVGAATVVLVLQSARSMNLTAAALLAASVAVFAWEFALGVFMTEVAGFVMGALALALLLAFSESKRPLWLVAGMAFLSVAVVSRAGAVFVLPAALLWSLLLPRHPARSKWVYVSLALAGASVGPVLQFTEVWLLGADPSNSGGNFAASLYGLSTGSRNWSEAYDHFRAVFNTEGETAAFKVIYAAALHNIWTQPDVFIQTLSAAFWDYWHAFFAIGALGRWSDLLWVLFVVGGVGCFMSFRRDSWPSLLVLLLLGEVAAAPFIVDSGGVRVFAATIAIRFLVCAAGVQWLLHNPLRTLRRELPANPAVSANVARVGFGVGAVVVALMIFPVLPLGDVTRLQAVQDTGRCTPGLEEVISRLGNESAMVTITDRAAKLQSLDPFQIGISRLAEDPRYLVSVYGQEIQRLPVPITFVRAVDRSDNRTEPISHVAYEGVLTSSDVPRILCVDRSSEVTISRVKHYLIREIRDVSEND